MESAAVISRRQQSQNPGPELRCGCGVKLDPTTAHHIMEGQGTKARCPKCYANHITPHEAKVAGLGHHLKGHGKAPSEP